MMVDTAIETINHLPVEVQNRLLILAPNAYQGNGLPLRKVWFFLNGEMRRQLHECFMADGGAELWDEDDPGYIE